MGRNGSGGVLIMPVSAIVPEKSCGNKKCDEEEEEEEVRHIFGLFGIAVTWLCATLLISVHSVEDSMLMSIFDQFRFSFFLSGFAKNRP